MIIDYDYDYDSSALNSYGKINNIHRIPSSDDNPVSKPLTLSLSLRWWIWLMQSISFAIPGIRTFVGNIWYQK